MNSKVKFAAMSAVELAVVATLAACGGGSGADTSAADSGDMATA